MQKVKTALVFAVGVAALAAIWVVGTLIEAGFTVAKWRLWQWLFG